MKLVLKTKVLPLNYTPVQIKKNIITFRLKVLNLLGREKPETVLPGVPLFEIYIPVRVL
jgi:hypothetical protein